MIGTYLSFWIKNILLRPKSQTFLWFFLLAWSYAAQAQTYSLVVQGLGGTPEYEKEFSRDANAIASVMSQLSEYSAHHVLLTHQFATRATILQKIDELVVFMDDDDRFILTLLGHGSFDGKEFKFNLPGKDINGSELVAALDKIPAHRQLIIVASSSSGAILERLSTEGRIVVTATRNGRERNAVSFAQHWAKALISDLADTNKDELLSATEAFRFVEQNIQNYYKAENLLAPEHPAIIGNSAASFYLTRTGKLTGSENNLRVSGLLEERSQLAETFYSLKNRKSELPEDAYLDSLQKVLLQIALLQQSLDAELDSTRGANEDS